VNVKSVSKAFTWLWINENQSVPMANKKKTKLGSVALRQKPIQLKEGDIIGVRFVDEADKNVLQHLDWDTELDALRREENQIKSHAVGK
jgi:hypothetical protein